MRVPEALLPTLRWLRDTNVFYYRNAHLYVCDVETIARQRGNPDVTVRIATRDDLLSMTEGDRLRFRKAWLERFDTGSVCFLGSFQGTVAGYLWLARGPTKAREVHQVLDVSRVPRSALMYDVKVEPSHRRRNVFTTMFSAVPEWAREQGFTRVYVVIASENTASKKAHAKAGFRRLPGGMLYLRTLGREWKRVTLRPGAREIVVKYPS